MSRLPTPGGDEGSWGSILNDFLSVEHNPDGTLKLSGTLSIKYTKPSTGIPQSDLDSAVQTSLSKADGALLASNNLSDVADVPTSRTNLGLGTAAVKNVPAAGNASATEVVYGSDTRLTDSRTPTAHESTHQSGGSDTLTGNLDAIARVTVAKSGVSTGSRRTVNFIPGSGINLTTADDSVNEKVDVTVASTALADPTSSKGDIIVHGTTTDRLAVGSDGQVLTADSTKTAGVAWESINFPTLQSARLKKTVLQTIGVPAGYMTAITWDSTEWDDAGYWSSGSTITIPSTGRYEARGWVNTNAGSNRILKIYKNGSAVGVGQTTVLFGYTDASVTGIFQATAGDTIALMAYNDTGTANINNGEFYVSQVGNGSPNPGSSGAPETINIIASVPSGQSIGAGVIGDVKIPFDATLDSIDVIGDQSGSCVLDIYSASTDTAIANSTSANSICGTNLPTISMAQTYADASLSTWNTTLTAGNWLRFVVNSSSWFTRLSISLKIRRA